MGMRVAVAHMGARRYYSLPRLFYERGSLASFHTEFYVKARWGRVLLGGLEKVGLRKATDLKGRYHPGLEGAQVKDYKAFGILYRWRRQRAPAHERRSLNQAAFQAFDRKILRKGLNDPDVVYAFPGEAQDLFEGLGSGITRILDQNSAGYRTFREVTQKEQGHWSGWEAGINGGEDGDPLTEREEREWILADGVVAPSDFVVQSLQARGVPAEKIDVVPYPADLTAYVPKRREARRGPLRVLFLGNVNLMKGIPYLLEAAARLGPEVVEVRVVGGIEVTRERLVPYEEGGSVRFLGRVPRSGVADHLDWADILCMPSLCEGQSLATNEALASGLPVVCTPNSGSRVRDGVDGTIVPPRDIDSLAEAIERYARDREFLRWQSDQAIADRDRLGFSAYGEALFDVVKRRFEGKNQVMDNSVSISGATT